MLKINLQINVGVFPIERQNVGVLFRETEMFFTTKLKFEQDAFATILPRRLEAERKGEPSDTVVSNFGGLVSCYVSTFVLLLLLLPFIANLLFMLTTYLYLCVAGENAGSLHKTLHLLRNAHPIYLGCESVQ